MEENWYGDDKATLGDRISAAREGAGMTAEALARKLGLRTRTLAGWENDEREPRAQQIRMLAGLTGVSLIWLLTGEGADAPTPLGEGRRSSDQLSQEAQQAQILALRQTLEEATRQLNRLERLLADG